MYCIEQECSFAILRRVDIVEEVEPKVV